VDQALLERTLLGERPHPVIANWLAQPGVQETRSRAARKPYLAQILSQPGRVRHKPQPEAAVHPPGIGYGSATYGTGVFGA
jgi:hypothetical protein